MDERVFARFHLDAGIGDVVVQPLETIVCRDWLGFAGIESSRTDNLSRTAVRRKGSCLHASPEQYEQQSERLGGTWRS